MVIHRFKFALLTSIVVEFNKQLNALTLHRIPIKCDFVGEDSKLWRLGLRKAISRAPREWV